MKPAKLRDIKLLEISERGSEIGVRINYKGKDYDGYLLEVVE